MANSSINLVDLDFFSLKESFKSYLRGQSAFKDYDWDGSNLNVLIDLLTYNTTKNSFYLQMALAEGFLDSAQMKSSIFSRAKELNYLPRSTRSAKANITVNFTAVGDSQPYIIPKGSSFSTLIKSQSYIFTIPETLLISSATKNFTFTTDIFEGRYLKDSYIFKANIENQRFRISNKNVDTSSLAVVVFEDGDTVGARYSVATTLLDLTEKSKVFFLQASENGFYEILFGNDVLGRRPKTNSTILIDYRISSGEASNGAKNFVINFNPTSPTGELTANPIITTNDVAGAGAEAETLDSVRYYAPRHFQVQERAVTTSDYKILLKTKFPEIRSVSVFGGETVNPPLYGKVFVAVDIPGVNGIPENKKLEYYDFLKKRSIVSIDPIFVNPNYTFLSVSSVINYNVNLTNNTAQNIKTLTINTINNFNDEFLNDFGPTFRYSKLTKTIDDIDPSIISNMTEVLLFKQVFPLLSSYTQLSLTFSVPLARSIVDRDTKHQNTDKYSTQSHTLSSSQFRFKGENAILEDDGAGIIRIMRVDNTSSVKMTDIGTVDYYSGSISISNFFIDDYEGNALEIYVRPAQRDISIPQDTILSIPSNHVQVFTRAVSA